MLGCQTQRITKECFMKHQAENTAPAVDKTEGVSRRKFIGSLGTTAAGAVAIGALAPLVDKGSSAAAQKAPRIGEALSVERKSFYQQRAVAARKFRVDCAHDNFTIHPPLFDRPDNGDETLYPNRIGNYSKGLPHQANGEVVPAAYNAMLTALASGNPA